MKSKHNKQVVWVLEMHFDGEDRKKNWESWEVFMSAEKAVKAFQKLVNKGHGNVRILKYVPKIPEERL